MAAEGDMSGSNFVMSQRRQHILQTMNNINRKLRLQTRQTFDDSDKADDEMEKLISVDEFDDSEDEDVHSSSTISPTPSDQAANNIISSHHYGPGSKADSSLNSCRLRKKVGLVSKVLDEDDLQSLRLKINSRERKRMHDLNSALDGLREVMPYAHGPSVRKLSKIATLLLAKNYILMLNSSMEEMKKLVSDIYHNHGPTPAPGHHHVAHSLASQPPASHDGTTVSSRGRSAPTNSPTDNRPASHGNHPVTLTNTSADVSHPFPYSTAVIPPSHLPSHHSVIHAMLPLQVPAIRAPVSGLMSRDALTSSYVVHKSEAGVNGSVQAFPTRECAHALQRWSVPCSCVHCLTGMGNIPLGLHLTRSHQPLVTSSTSLNRKPCN